MKNSSPYARLETGNGWMKIRSPRRPFPLWLQWVPAIPLVVIGFVYPAVWIGAAVFALVGGINYVYARNVYAQFEVLIDFEKRAISWSGESFNKDGLYGLSAWPPQGAPISFDQIEYIAVEMEMLKLPCLVLVLKNRERVLLSTFDGVWARDRVLTALESHLNRNT